MNRTLLSQLLCRQSLIVFANVSIPDLSTANDWKECCCCPLTVSKSAATSLVFPLVGAVVRSLFKHLIRTIMLLLIG